MRTPRLPDSLVLLLACVFIAAILTHVVPAGEYERRQDPATGRRVVVAGSFHAVPAKPVGVFETFVAVPQGMVDAGSVIFLVFLVGGAFSVVDRTGAFAHGIEWLSHRFRRRSHLIIPLVSVVFATGGALEGMWEEVIALVPVLLFLSRRNGFDALTAIAMSLGAAGIGSTFGPVNPFSVGIAQRVAELPLLSGLGFRVVVMLLALAIWVWGTMRYAARVRVPPAESDASAGAPSSPRHTIALAAVAACFAIYVYGAVRYNWGFDQLSGLFLAMGIVVGLIGGLRVSGTTEAFVDGFRSMAYAAVIIGVARAIFVVLDHGHIVDTLINAMVGPLVGLPRSLFAVGMAVVQTVVAFPVPSSSGRAVLTLPILVPLSDLLGVSRQVTVLAYQYGPGLVGQVSPTDGALMAVLALAGIRYEAWFKFAVPLCLGLFVLSLAAILVAVAIGLA
jgi:uncharacterized ion transporter superfamily protein YfcC